MLHKIVSPNNITNKIYFFWKKSVMNTLRLILHFFRKDKVTQAAQDVGVTKMTAIQNHYLREVREVAEAHDRTMIGGPMDVVEIDESHLYTSKYLIFDLVIRLCQSFDKKSACGVD
jgi:hypothetical protein